MICFSSLISPIFFYKSCVDESLAISTVEKPHFTVPVVGSVIGVRSSVRKSWKYYWLYIRVLYLRTNTDCLYVRKASEHVNRSRSRAAPKFTRYSRSRYRSLASLSRDASRSRNGRQALSSYCLLLSTYAPTANDPWTRDKKHQQEN